MKKILAIASVVAACALLSGCSSDKADEIYAKLNGQTPEVRSLDTSAVYGDGLADDLLPEGVLVAINRTALAVSDLSLFDAPSPAGGMVGTAPAGARVQVTGVVRRLDGSRWYAVTYQEASGYTCGGLDFSATPDTPDSTPIPDPTSDPDATPSPELTPDPDATPAPEPTPDPDATPAPEPTPDPDAEATSAPTPDPDSAQAVSPASSLDTTATPSPSEDLSAADASAATPEPEVASHPDSEPTPSPEVEWPAETILRADASAQKDNVGLHTHPSAQARVVDTVDRDAMLSVVSRVHMPDGDWYGILWHSDKAYVRGDLIALSKTASDIPEDTGVQEPAPTPETTPATDCTPEPEATPAPETTPATDCMPEPEATPAPETTPGTDCTPEPEATPAPETMPSPETPPLPELLSTPNSSPTPDDSPAPEDTANST